MDYYKILKTTDGRIVRVPPGEYGWKLDRKKEIKEIAMGHKNEMAEVTTALNNNTLAIQKLCERLGDTN